MTSATSAASEGVKAAFFLGVTGRRVFPGYDDAVADAHELSAAARGLRNRIWDLLDGLLYEEPQSSRRREPVRFRTGGVPAAWPRLQHTPIVLLSSLAPGADTVVAEAVLDYATERAAPVSVRAVLPFPEAQYRRSASFTDASDPQQTAVRQRRFDSLLARIRAQPGFVESRDILSVLLHPSHDGDPESDLRAEKGGQARRDLRFRAAGEYVAATCHVLLAVYDERERRTTDWRNVHVAGTEAIVEVKRSGTSFELLAFPCSFSGADSGPVLLLPIDRDGDGARACARPPAWLHPYGARPAVPIRAGRWERALCALGLHAWVELRELESPPLADDDRRWQEQGHWIAQRILEHQERFNGAAMTSATTPRPLDPLLFQRSHVRTAPMWLARFFRPVLTPLQAALSAAPRESTVTSTPTPRQDALRSLRPEFADSLSPLAEAQSRASAKADTLDAKRGDLLWSFLWTILLAASTLGAYEHWPNPKELPISTRMTHVGLLGVTLISLLVIGMRFHAHRRSQAEDHRFDLRALAEGLRVQIAWCLAGVRGAVSADYMQRQRGELAWIRHVIAALAFPMERWVAGFGQLSHAEKISALRLVRDAWLMDQLQYFDRTAAKRQAMHHVLHVAGWSLASAGLLNVVGKFLVACVPGLKSALKAEWPTVSVIGVSIGAASLAATFAWKLRRTDAHGQHLGPNHGPADPVFWNWLALRPVQWGWALAIGSGVLGLAYTLGQLDHPRSWPDAGAWWLILTGVVLLLGGLALVWNERNFYAEDLRRYGAMRDLFQSALRRYDGILEWYERSGYQDPVQADALERELQDLCYQLGCEALDENAEWLILHRTRPLEPFLTG